MQIKLADLPSELILQGLEHLELIEKTPNFDVYMGVYVLINKGHCQTCLAGSIMYMGTPAIQKNLRSRKYGRYNPSDYSDKVANKLRFLSNFQFGCFEDAFADLGIKLPDFLPRMDMQHMPNYRDDKRAYKRKLKNLAKKLAKHGL